MSGASHHPSTPRTPITNIQPKPSNNPKSISTNEHTSPKGHSNLQLFTPLHPLHLNQLKIPSPRRQQALMIPTLHHLSLINNINEVRVLDGAETVRNGDCGAAFGDAVECFLDDFLGGGV